METIEGYSILQWSIFFMSYCILGWVFESFYCSLKSGHLRNRGFCHGPWLPLYGSGATLLILLVWPYRDRHILVFMTGFFGGTALELFTGLLMEHLFNMRWWDYSHNPFNFHGYICLYAAIGWGVLALFITEFIHPHIERISRNWSYSTFLVVNTMLYTLFIEDAVASVFGALDLRDRLSRLAESSEEIQSLKLSIQEVGKHHGRGGLHGARRTLRDRREDRARDFSGGVAAFLKAAAGTDEGQAFFAPGWGER